MERVKDNIFYISAAGDHTSLTEFWHTLGETSEEKDERMAAVINRRNHLKYTPLHCAIYARNIDTVTYLLEHGADPNLRSHGSPCMHLTLFSMALPGGEAFGAACAKLLIDYGTDLTMKDDQGCTALHIACDFNLAPIVEMILASPNVDDLMNAKDKLGMRPLHRCAIRDSVDAANILLSRDPTIILHTSNTRSTPLHMAATHGACGVWRVILEASHRTSSNTLLTAKDIWGRNAKEVAERHGGGAMIPHTGGDPVLRTLEPSHGLTAIITHPLCRMHHTCPPDEVEDMYAPPENIKRLSVLLDEKIGILRLRDMARCLRWVDRCRPAPMADVLRVHEWSYVRRIQAAVEDLSDDAFVHLDSDTAISRHSFAAAMHAAGGVCQAVDMVLSKEVRNAFCAVRPPGHHAGPVGLVTSGKGGDSHGFCLLNNISIAAAYAMSVHRDLVKTVAIVDFDVHHGNGTEETLRWLVPAVDTTEIRTGFSFGAVNTPRYKPWYDDSDVDRVMFVSVHGYGPRDHNTSMPCASFYPGTGKTTIPSVKTPEERVRTHSEQHVVSSSAPPTITMSDDGDDDDDDDDDDSDWQSNDEEKESINEHGPRDAMQKIVSEYDSYEMAAHGRSEPMILNVGEGLPSDPEITIASGEYRHAWRNCFRFCLIVLWCIVLHITENRYSRVYCRSSLI